MRVQITERHCEVPEEVLERTEKQLETLSKYEPRVSAADVIYSEEKRTRKVEVIVHVDGEELMVAHGESEQFRSALDQVVDRLRRRLRSQRERRVDHQAPPLGEQVGDE